MTIRRWSGIAGIVFVVLAILSAIVRGSLPDTGKRNAVLSSLFFAVWTIVISVIFLTRPEPAT